MNWGEEQTTTKTVAAGQTQQAQVTASHTYSSPLPPDLLPTEVSWTATARDEEELTDTVTWTVPYLDATAEDNQCFNPTLTVRYTGDPIDVATGGQRLEEDWLTLPGPLPLTFRLRYHSLLLRDGVFGRGWEDPTYQARLRFFPQGGVLVQWSNNRYNLFERQADGSYRATHGSCRFDSLVQTATGEFTLTRNGSLVYQFDTQGLLTTLGNAQGQVLQLGYDSQGRLTQVTDPLTSHYLVYSYNPANLVTTVSDSAGRQVQLGYDSQRHLTTVTDAVGQMTTYTYNDHRQLLTATDAVGQQRFRNTYDDHYRIASQDDGRPETPPLQFRYDDSTPNQRTTTVTDRAGQTRVYVTRRSDFQLLTLRDELGGITAFSYDTNGKLLSQTNPLGQTTRYEYDAQGNLVKAIDPAGAVTTLTYDEAHQPLVVTKALGQQVRLRYDSQHRLVSQTDPLQQVTTYTYNDDGQVQTHTSTGGGVTRYDYTAGLLTQLTLPAGNSYQLGYDEAGRIVSLRDPEGQTTTLTYDAANRLTTLTNALGHPLQLGYDGRDNLLYWQDANSHLTQRQYDGNGNLIAQTNALNQTTYYDYDAQDHLVKVTDAKGRVTQLHYDAKGRLIGLTNPLGDTQSLEYDAADKLLKQLDSFGQVVAQFNYDTRANLVGQLNALGNEEQLRYDALNRLVEVQDPLKRVTTFNYDALNRLTHSVDALGGNSHQGFDKEGNRDSLTDPNGNQTRFQFDQNGRLVKETLDTGDKVSYTYNARDLLAQVTNARGQSRQLEYDAAGRLVSVTDPEGTVSFSYDNHGNVLTVTDSQGIISRTYDALNRVTNYTDVNGNTLHYEYDEVGNLVALTYPDGKVVRYDYDAADQLVKVTDWAGRVTGYEYDKNGRLISEIRPNGTQMTRRYNVAGQLVQQVEKESDGNLLRQVDYSYDAAGNIVKEPTLPKPESVSLPPVTMTYSAANRLATYNEQTVQFDADGNLLLGPLAGEMANFSFDSRNRLIQAGPTSYRYDAENQRIGVNQTRYVINSQPALSQVLVKEENGVKTFYVYGLGLLGEEKDEEYRSYHFDFRGSTVALTDSTGKVVQRFQYGPYGELLKGEVSVTPFLFNGKYGVMTEGNGLYYMRARFYSAEIKRFVNQDVLLGKVGEGQSLNRYAFVTERPISAIDPFGLEAIITGDEIEVLSRPDTGASRTTWQFLLFLTPFLALAKGDLSLAQMLLLHSLQNNPSNLYFYEGSELVTKIINDKDYQGLVNGLITEAQQQGRNQCYQAFDQGKPIEFADGDLFYAIHKALIEVIGRKEGKEWILNVRLKDTYDFEHLPQCKYGAHLSYVMPGCILNEMAAFDFSEGTIQSYNIFILFNHYITE